MLKVISRSTFDLQTVLDTLLKSAARLCQADHSFVFLREGDVYRCASGSGDIPEWIEYLKQQTIKPGRGTIAARAVLEGRTVHIPDVLADPEYTFLVSQKVGGYRTALGVPLLREGAPIGVMVLTRPTVRPFDGSHIALVTTFADQAVIAIENNRLLNELHESLQQQTATADVLKVISRSTFGLKAVLNTLVELATRFCAADKGAIMMRDGDVYRIRANYGFAPEAVQYASTNPLQPDRNSLTGRVALDGKAVHIPDVLADAKYHETGYQQAFGYRTALGVPLLREGTTIGVFALTRDEVNAFTDKQIELVATFADQAVIAIENARLFEAEQQRTAELTESLEQQTATSEVLKVIYSSPGDLEPVFETVLENAVRICGAKFGNLFLYEGKFFRIGATHGAPHVYVEYLRREGPFRADPRFGLGRLTNTKQSYQVVDIAVQPTYDDKLRVATIELAGARTLLGVPMLKDGEVVGSIVIYRREVQPFTDKQAVLVENFAAQAVIAIENTRLMTELRQRTDDLTESLEQQTATSEVLQVISSSPGDLQPVFETMLDNAVRICDAKFGNIYQWDFDALHLVASHNTPDAFAEQRRREPFRPSPKNSVGQMIATKTVVHIPDVVASEAYIEREPVTVAGVEIAGIRTFLAVPMLKENELVGAFALARQEVRPFTEKQVDLVTSFAAQAVIAIENARLLTELRQRTDELAQRQAELSVTFDNMGDGVVMFNEEMRLAAWNKNLQEILDLPDSFFAEPRTYRDYMTYLIEHGEFGDVDLETELRRYIESADRQRRVERTRPDGRVLEVRVNPVGRRVRRDLQRRYRAQKSRGTGPSGKGSSRKRAPRVEGSAGPPSPNGKARFARATDRWHCPRNQEPAKFRQQFLIRLRRTNRRIA